jgi:hypothetical protein
MIDANRPTGGCRRVVTWFAATSAVRDFRLRGMLDADHRPKQLVIDHLTIPAMKDQPGPSVALIKGVRNEMCEPTTSPGFATL